MPQAHLAGTDLAVNQTPTVQHWFDGMLCRARAKKGYSAARAHAISDITIETILTAKEVMIPCEFKSVHGVCRSMQNTLTVAKLHPCFTPRCQPHSDSFRSPRDISQPEQNLLLEIAPTANRSRTSLAMLMRLTEELRGHVLLQLDPWSLWRARLTSNITVPAHVTAKHAAVLQRLQPEAAPPPAPSLGAILERLVVHVTSPLLALDSMYMEFPGFAGDVFASVRISGRRGQHSISRQRMLRALQLPEDTAPMMSESSGGVPLAIGMSILSRFAAMYPNEERAQAATAILRLGTYCYEVFHGYSTTDDDVAFLHFQVCGIAGVICLFEANSDSTGSDRPRGHGHGPKWVTAVIRIVAVTAPGGTATVTATFR